MTIAGTDSSGGAGIAADVRTFAACGVHGCFAVTAVTVQNSLGVSGVHPIPAEMLAAQIESIVTDIGLDAVKTGMLANAAIIEAIMAVCDRFGIGGGGPIPLVVDPVAASARGEQLLADAALEAIRTRLAPRASLITPNLDEVRLLIGIDVHDREAQYEAARRLHALGPRYVLVKGGHLREDVYSCVDLLYDGNTFSELPGPRFDTKQHSRCWRQHKSGHRIRAGEGDDHARRSRARQALYRGGRRALLLARRGAWPGIAAVDG